MKRASLIILPLLAMALTSGCASSPELGLGYKYATLKLIENETVTPSAVIERVERVGSLLENHQDMVFGYFLDQVKLEVGYAQLAPSDRLLVDAILGDAQLDLNVLHDSLLTDAHRLAINQRLGWIRDAAAMAGG